jgi:hypothetical protein
MDMTATVATLPITVTAAFRNIVWQSSRSVACAGANLKVSGRPLVF